MFVKTTPASRRASQVEAGIARDWPRTTFNRRPEGAEGPDSNRKRLSSVDWFSANHPTSGFRPSATRSPYDVRFLIRRTQEQMGTELTRLPARLHSGGLGPVAAPVEAQGPLPEADIGVRLGQGSPGDSTMTQATESLPVTDPRARAAGPLPCQVRSGRAACTGGGDRRGPARPARGGRRHPLLRAAAPGWAPDRSPSRRTAGAATHHTCARARPLGLPGARRPRGAGLLPSPGRRSRAPTACGSGRRTCLPRNC